MRFCHIDWSFIWATAMMQGHWLKLQLPPVWPGGASGWEEGCLQEQRRTDSLVFIQIFDSSWKLLLLAVCFLSFNQRNFPPAETLQRSAEESFYHRHRIISVYYERRTSSVEELHSESGWRSLKDKMKMLVVLVVLLHGKKRVACVLMSKTSITHTHTPFLCKVCLRSDRFLWAEMNKDSD